MGAMELARKERKQVQLAESTVTRDELHMEIARKREFHAQLMRDKKQVNLREGNNPAGSQRSGAKVRLDQDSFLIDGIRSQEQSIQTQILAYKFQKKALDASKGGIAVQKALAKVDSQKANLLRQKARQLDRESSHADERAIQIESYTHG